MVNFLFCIMIVCPLYWQCVKTMHFLLNQYNSYLLMTVRVKSFYGTILKCFDWRSCIGFPNYQIIYSSLNFVKHTFWVLQVNILKSVVYSFERNISVKNLLNWKLELGIFHTINLILLEHCIIFRCVSYFELH